MKIIHANVTGTDRTVFSGIEVGVCAILRHVSKERGTPKCIKVDNGPEFISKALDAWTYGRKIQLVFSRSGSPNDNAHIESFNGSLR